MGISVGLGLTNECNLHCPHCYRDAGGTRRLTLAEVQAVMQALPVRSVNLGYAENGLHPDFVPVVWWLAEQPCQLALTSNGHSVGQLPDDLLRSFTEIELSLDFPDAARQDSWRGEGNFAEVLGAIRRCRNLSVPVTVLAVLMRSNFRDVVAIGRIAFAEGARLRVNVYQAAKTDLYRLTYEEYWEAFRHLLGEFALVSTSEPVLAAALGLAECAVCGCGRSTVRVMPSGAVVPCTYWPGAGSTLADLVACGEAIFQTPAFVDSRLVPVACAACPFAQTCGGGCAGRRALCGGLTEPDPYCRLVKGDPWDVPVRRGPASDLPKSQSACTTIFAP